VIASGRFEERLACFVDSGRSCCGILRTDAAGQYVRKDATGVVVNVGFVARRKIDHLRCQRVPGDVRELALEQLPFALIVMGEKIRTQCERAVSRGASSRALRCNIGHPPGDCSELKHATGGRLGANPVASRINGSATADAQCVIRSPRFRIRVDVSALRVAVNLCTSATLANNQQELCKPHMVQRRRRISDRYWPSFRDSGEQDEGCEP
jgi:hypothetical protein